MSFRIKESIPAGLRFRIQGGPMKTLAGTIVVTTGRTVPLYYHVLSAGLFKHEVRVVGEPEKVFFADLDQFECLSVSPWAPK